MDRILTVRCGEEHDVACNDRKLRHIDEDIATIDDSRQETHGNSTECSNDVRRHGPQLLLNNRRVRVNGSDNGGREEGKSLNSNVCEQKDDRSAECHGGEDTPASQLPRELLQDFCDTDTF